MSTNMGELINKRRLELGMTLEELGNKVHVSKSTVHKWETGNIENMRRDKIADLASALQVSPAYLMGWKEDEVHRVSLYDLGILEVNADALETGKIIAEYIEKFYQLTDDHQNQILEVIDMFAEKDGEADGKI